MLIRSQNGKVLVNMDNVTNIYLSGNGICICYTHNDEFEHIGVYSSKEKAIKVLDMIQEDYINSSRIVYGGRMAESAIVQEVSPRNTVFQMPADEEVEC